MSFEQTLSTYSQEIQAVVSALRELVLSLFPDAVETSDADNLGYGFDKGNKRLVFVITPHRSHVNLGFFRGAELPDPLRLLKGSGKLHRHVKVRSLEALENPDLESLMVLALENARQRKA